MSPNGKTLLSHAYNGAISIWEQDHKGERMVYAYLGTV